MTQLEQGQSETCPACQTEDIDHSVEEFEGVCDTCGFVLQEDTNSVKLEWEITDGAFQRPEKGDWFSKSSMSDPRKERAIARMREMYRGYRSENLTRGSPCS